jgi:pimeloyl-ACP methyl ester carboxylesterase
MNIETGYSKNGLPYARVEGGKRVLFIIDGLDFSHKPPSHFEMMVTSFIKKLIGEFTVYQVRRKPGLPVGYSLKDMSDDCAVMIRDELDWPVDVMGISTGGTIAQYFAADHPELVNRLVLAMTGHRLRDEAREMQMRLGELAVEGKYRAAAALMSGAIFSGMWGRAFKAVFWLFGKSMFGSQNPSDGIIEIEAEDKHNFKDRLAEIKMPTLVIGGDRDFFYPIRETAEGIPGARLVLYKGAGHMAMMKSRFGEDILAFLTGDTSEK